MLNPLERISKSSASIFKISIWSTIYIFLITGSMAAILLTLKEYPEYIEIIYPLITVSELMARFALAAFIVCIVTAFLGFLLKKYNEKEVKKQ